MCLPLKFIFPYRSYVQYIGGRLDHFPIAFTASVAGRICRYIACVDISELTADTARKRREYLNISKQPGPCVARALRV